MMRFTEAEAGQVVDAPMSPTATTVKPTAPGAAGARNENDRGRAG